MHVILVKKTILFHLITLWEFIESSLPQEFKPTLTTVASMMSQSDKRVQRTYILWIFFGAQKIHNFDIKCSSSIP